MKTKVIMKYKNWIFAFVGIMTVLLYKFFMLSSIDSFGIATVIDSYHGFSKNQFDYEYFISDRRYTGYYRGITVSKVELNEKYILIYDSKNPGNHTVVFDLPYLDENQLDSLKACCKPSEIVSLFKF